MRPAEVVVRVPAEPPYALVLRGAASSAATLAGLSVADVEDLRTAVGEAVSLVLDQTRAGSHLSCTFLLEEATVMVRLRGECRRPRMTETTCFRWRVLDALTSQPAGEVTDSALVVSFALPAEESP